MPLCSMCVSSNQTIWLMFNNEWKFDIKSNLVGIDWFEDRLVVWCLMLRNSDRIDFDVDSNGIVVNGIEGRVVRYSTFVYGAGLEYDFPTTFD